MKKIFYLMILLISFSLNASSEKKDQTNPETAKKTIYSRKNHKGVLEYTDNPKGGGWKKAKPKGNLVVIPQSSQEIVPNLYEGEDPPSILKVEQGRLKKTANSDKTLLETLLKQSHRSRRKAKSIPTRKNKRNYQRLLHAIEELKKSINRKELERKELDKILKEN